MGWYALHGRIWKTRTTKKGNRWVSQRREDKWQQGAGHMLEAEYERSVETSNLGSQKFFGKPSVTVSNLQ
jgi:hypothetical protein